MSNGAERPVLRVEDDAMIKRVLATALLLAGLGGAAVAGPFEDGGEAWSAGDLPKAQTAWKALADAGDPRGQFNLGVLYDQGKGVPQDKVEAFRWYKLAAEQGDVIAAFNVGTLYLKGDGVAANPAEGVRWLKAAADKDDTLAQYNLGLIFAEGRGVPQDYKEAAKYYEMAANKKHAQAQNNLGQLYANGQGVEQDMGKASEWMEKAGENGMFGETNTACTTQSSARNLEACRRIAPRF